MFCNCHERHSHLLNLLEAIMASQADLAAALDAFAADVEAGLAAVTAALPNPVDLQPELDKLAAIKTQFDAFVASVVPPAEPAPEPQPAPEPTG